MSKDEINAFLGSGTRYQGQLNFQGAVRIDGTFTGEITSDGTLIVGTDAIIDGTLNVGQLVLSGTVNGEVTATRKIVIHKTGIINGTIRTPALIMEDGARIEGEVHMGADSTATTQ